MLKVTTARPKWESNSQLWVESPRPQPLHQAAPHTHTVHLLHAHTQSPSHAKHSCLHIILRHNHTCSYIDSYPIPQFCLPYILICIHILYTHTLYFMSYTQYTQYTHNIYHVHHTPTNTCSYIHTQNTLYPHHHIPPTHV